MPATYAKKKQFKLAIQTYQTLLQEIRSNKKEIEIKELGKVLLGLGQVYEDQILPHQISNSFILNEINNVFFPAVFINQAAFPPHHWNRQLFCITPY